MNYYARRPYILLYKKCTQDKEFLKKLGEPYFKRDGDVILGEKDN